MIIGNMSEMYRGWFIGNFEPSLLKTDAFEIGTCIHKKGEKWPVHYHAIATEYNVILSGSMRIAGNELVAGNYFVIAPGEIADPVFHEDCVVICVKTPSVPGDKYIVENENV